MTARTTYNSACVFRSWFLNERQLLSQIVGWRGGKGGGKQVERMIVIHRSSKVGGVSLELRGRESNDKITFQVYVSE